MVSCTRLLLAILRHETNWTCCCTINSYHHLSYDDTPILPSPFDLCIALLKHHAFSSRNTRKPIWMPDHQEEIILTAAYGPQLLLGFYGQYRSTVEAYIHFWLQREDYHCHYWNSTVQQILQDLYRDPWKPIPTSDKMLFSSATFN